VEVDAKSVALRLRIEREEINWRRKWDKEVNLLAKYFADL
jgi:hypothetical protein